jgi:signal transduction histidine kinase/ActR/RegA family two-component response regulator
MIWHARMVRLGRLRTMLLLTAFSVVASVALVVVFFVLFDGQREDLAAYFVPAVIVPALVAPPVIHLLLGLAVALEAAHARAAQHQEQLQRVRQLDLVGRLASGLAHDFNNLLTVVRANVAALGGATMGEELAAIDRAAVKGARLTRRLLSISRHEVMERVAQPVAPLLRETEEMLRRILSPTLLLEMPPDVPDVTIEFDHDAIQQALLNLALNARDAMGAHGRLTVTVHERQAADGPWLVIEVRDNGPGMPPELLRQAAEPFFTTKAAHEGTGLGLAIVHRCMTQHDGRLVLDSDVGVGTTAALWFPSNRRGRDVVVHERVPSTPPTRIERSGSYDLLVIDDEPEIRSVTERALRRMGHRVTSVGDITAAFAWLETVPPVDAIVSDVMMPGGTGIDLVHHLRRTGRTTPVLLVSGFALEGLDDVLSADPTVAFLPKPWAFDALMTSLEGVIHHANAGTAPRS